MAAAAMIPLPGLGLGCGDHYSCQPSSSCQGGACDNLLDPGTPTQGLSPAALTSVPRRPGQGAQREGWHESQRGWHLCVTCRAFSLPVYLPGARAAVTAVSPVSPARLQDQRSHGPRGRARGRGSASGCPGSCPDQHSGGKPGPGGV